MDPVQRSVMSAEQAARAAAVETASRALRHKSAGFGQGEFGVPDPEASIVRMAEYITNGLPDMPHIHVLGGPLPSALRDALDLMAMHAEPGASEPDYGGEKSNGEKVDEPETEDPEMQPGMDEDEPL